LPEEGLVVDNKYLEFSKNKTNISVSKYVDDRTRRGVIRAVPRILRWGWGGQCIGRSIHRGQ